MPARTSAATYAETSGCGPVTTRAAVGVAGDVSRGAAGDGEGALVVGGGEQVAGVRRHRAQLGDGAVEGDRAAAHDGDVVADLLDLVHVVGAEQHRQSAAGEPLDQGPHVPDAGRVQAVGGLVEDQQPRARAAGSRPRRGAAASRRSSRRPSRRPGRSSRRASRTSSSRPGRVPPSSSDEALEVLPAGQVGVEPRALDEARRRRPGRRRRASSQVWPKTRMRAGVGTDQPEQHPQEGRLPGAVGSQDAVHLALRPPGR